MAITPDKIISYPPGSPITVVDPLALDPYQLVNNVHWPNPGSETGQPSHIAVLYQLSLVPSFGAADGFDWGSNPGKLLWICNPNFKYLYYPSSGVWGIPGPEAGVYIDNFVNTHIDDAGGAAVNNFGAGSIGIYYNHNATLPGVQGDLGVGPLWRIDETGEDAVAGPSPMTRVTQLRAGRLEAQYTRGPGGGIIGSWYPTEGITVRYGNMVGSVIGHVVNKPYMTYTFSLFNDADGTLISDGNIWPDDHWSSVGYEIYAI